MLLSWFIGQKKYPVPYDGRSILGFFALALLFFAAYTLLSRTGMGPWPLMGLGTLMLLFYCLAAWKLVVRR